MRHAAWLAMLSVLGCGARSELDDPRGGARGTGPNPSRTIIATITSATFNGQRQLALMSDLEGTGYVTEDLDGEIGEACDTAIDAEGRVLFVERKGTQSRIVRYDRMSGETESYVTSDDADAEVVGISGIGLDAQDRIYGVDPLLHRVFRIDDIDGSGFVVVGSGPGDGPLELDRPSDVDVFADGRIVVSDYGNGRIVRMADMTGAGWQAYQPGALTIDPIGVAVDDTSGAIYAVDFNASALHRIDAFDEFVQTALLPDQPSHVAVGPNGRFYMSFVNGLEALGVMDGLDPSTLTTYHGPPDEPLVNPCGIAVR